MTTINALTDLETLEVSLVKRGANRKKFAFAKAEELMSGLDEVLKAVLETETDDENKVAEIFGKDLSERGASAVKGALRLLSAFKDELPGDVFQKLTRIAGQEESAADDMEDDMEKAKKAGEDYQYDSPVEKSMDTQELPEEMRAKVEQLFKAHGDAIAKAEALERVVEKMRSDAAEKECVAKAEKQFGALPGKSAQEIGRILKSVQDTDSKMATQLEELLASANDVIVKSGLFSEAGSNQSEGASAWERIEAIAKGIRDADPKVSVAKSVDMAMEQNPDLYAAYAKDNTAQFGR